MVKLLHEGYRRSMTFQHLVDRIERSAVIVYIEVGVLSGTAARLFAALGWAAPDRAGTSGVLVETDQQTDRLLAGRPRDAARR